MVSWLLTLAQEIKSSQPLVSQPHCFQQTARKAAGDRDMSLASV
jgi:hypothetical protein